MDAAAKAGAKKLLLQNSIFTNGRAKGKGLSPVFLVINGIVGALDKTLEVKLLAPVAAELSSLLGLTIQPCSAV